MSQAPRWHYTPSCTQLTGAQAASRRVRKPTRRPMSAIDRRPGRSALSRKNSQVSEGDASNFRQDRSPNACYCATYRHYHSTGRTARSTAGLSRLRSQYDELNVLERVFEDIMLYGEEESQEEQGFYYSKVNDELMTETEFLEFVEVR